MDNKALKCVKKHIKEYFGENEGVAIYFGDGTFATRSNIAKNRLERTAKHKAEQLAVHPEHTLTSSVPNCDRHDNATALKLPDGKYIGIATSGRRLITELEGFLCAIAVSTDLVTVDYVEEALLVTAREEHEAYEKAKELFKK